MKISYNWLKDFVDLKKYPVPKLADLLTMNFAEVDGIETVGDDSIFDLKILPDRASDCLSHIGVAREVVALTNSRIKNQESRIKVKESKKYKIKDLIEVINEEPEICKRYVSRVIKNVKIGPSPKWLTQRLESIGQKSINNIVDATNYVMFEFGQPLHAFDFDKCDTNMRMHANDTNNTNKKKIIIRKAKNGERIMTLDGQEIELNSDILVIADDKDPLAIAGIKGGKKAEIDKDTKNIVLESANFGAEFARKASKIINIRTESSIRFVADLDPNLAGMAMERLASLINQIAGGEIVSGKIDIYPKKVLEYKVGFSMEDIPGYLGIELPEKDVIDILKRLNFGIKRVSPLKEILKLVPKFAGRPYKYGASVTYDAPNVFDCSSFTSYVFAQSGIQIPRMTVDQYFFSEAVDEKSAKPGDLVFANTKEGKIFYESQEFLRGTKIKEGVDHVGLYVGNGKVIHATRKTGKVVTGDIKKSKSFKNFRGFRRIKDIERESIFVVDVPTYRRDVKLKADILEEIARFSGYQNLVSKLPESFLISPKRNDEVFWENMAKNALVSAGFSEVYNYSFVGNRDLQNIGLDSRSVLELQNYPNDDRRYLRPSLVFGFLKNIKDNFRHFDSINIFEIGRVFGQSADKILERKSLGGAISYKKSSNKNTATEFYEIKAAVDLLMRKLGIPEVWYDDYRAELESFEKNIHHPLRSAEIKIGDKRLGFIREINAKVLDAYEIDSRVAVFEIDLENLARFATEEYAYRPLSKYPAVERDLAILTPLNTKVDEVLNVLENVGGQLLVNTDLFDIYEGDNIPESQKSLAFHLIFQSQDRTLSDNEINNTMSKIISVIEEEGWEIRK